MTAVTRWVLAHKRLVTLFWVVLTLVGMASAGSATKALKQKFLVPGKEGWETNSQIARDFRGTGGNAAPLLTVVTLPPGASVDSPQVKHALLGVERRLLAALPARGSPVMRPRRATRSSPQTAARRSRSPIRRLTPVSPSVTIRTR